MSPYSTLVTAVAVCSRAASNDSDVIDKISTGVIALDAEAIKRPSRRMRLVLKTSVATSSRLR